MAHDAFISHSSMDKTIADAVCATLEGKNIRCWIAPRDVPPGTHYGAALDRAIENSKIFVLLISKGSNNSDQVIRELEIAADNGIPIIPIRIEDFEPTDAMRYYVKSLHWLDAMTPPLERHLEKITASVKALLSIEADETTSPVGETITETPPKKHFSLPVWAPILLGLTALLIFGGWYGLTKLNTAEEILPSAEISELTPKANPASTLSTSDTNSILSDWKPIEFTIPGNGLWRKDDGRYSVIGSNDTIAWSDEIFTGDIEISLDIESSNSFSAANIIVYGNGGSLSNGNLIFTIASDQQSILADSVYDNGTFLSSSVGSLSFAEQKHAMLISIIDRKATLILDGEEISSVFLKDSINSSGKIGLLKIWEIDEISFSNIRVKELESVK